MNDIEERKYKIKSLIESLINDGQFDDAKYLLNDYINSVKDDIEAYSMLSVVLCALGESDKAENAIMHGLMIDRFNFDLNYNFAELYFNKGNYEMALVYYRFSYQNTEETYMKNQIKDIVKDIFIKLKYSKEVTEYLNEDINLVKDKSCLILCHFNSVYTQEFIKNIKQKTNYSIDVLSMDNTYKNAKINYTNQVYCYKDIYELYDFFNKINNYDVIHIHFLTPFYEEVAKLIRSKCNKLIITIWGSDFLRTTDDQKNMQRKLIQKADILTFDNELVLNDFAGYFGEYCKEKSVICRFGLTALEYLSNLKSKDKEQIKNELKIPQNAIVVTCGYNANAEHNHLDIIEALNKVKNKLPTNIYFIFPMTYSKNEEYILKTKEALTKSGLKYKILEDFMELEENAKYTILSDIMIQVQTTDTLSASMQEQMYCGNMVITGSWLPYKPLKDKGVYFFEVDSVSEVGGMLIEVVNSFDEFMHKCKNNEQLIWDYSAWENTIMDWEKVYIEKNKNRNKIIKRKKVLVIAYFFPPIGGAGVQRTLKYVKYLRDFGWEPIVVTAGKSNYFAKDESLLKEVPYGVQIIRIDDFVDEKISIQFLNQLIQMYSAIVNDNNLISEFINKVNLNDENFNKYIFTPDAYVAWAYKVINSIEQLISFNDIDLIYSTSSPYSDHLIALFIKQKFGKPWVADFRDEWTNNPFTIYDKNDLKFKMERKMEEEVVNAADAITTISDIAVQNYVNIFNLDSSKVKCITNGYDEADFNDIEIYKNKTDKFRIIHNGFLYGEERYPVNFFAAVLNLIRKGIIDENKIEMYFARTENDKYFKSLINKYHLDRIIKCLGYLEHKKSLLFSSKVNCCLLVVGSGEKSKSVYTGKVFEYLRTGKPILSLAPSGGLVDKLLNETGRGYNCEINDKDKIEKVIGDLYNKWINNKEESYEPDKKIIKYERRNLTCKLAKIFNFEYELFNGTENKQDSFENNKVIENSMFLICEQNYDEAKKIIEKYKEVYNNNSKISYLEALILMKECNIEKAENIIRKTLVNDNNEYYLLGLLAKIEENKNNYLLAVNYYKKTLLNINNNINNGEYLKNRINELKKKNQTIGNDICENEFMKSNKILVTCTFYSVFVKEFIQKLNLYYGTKFDILAFDNSFSNKINTSALNNIIVCNGNINSTIKKINDMQYYDVINIHYVSPIYGVLADQIRNKCDKLMVTVWGSDFYRTSNEIKEIQRKLYSSADVITFNNEGVRNDFINYYGEEYRNKSKINRFGLTAIEYMNQINIKEKDKLKNKYGIPVDSIVITCGYNATKGQNHLTIIDSLLKIKDQLPKNVFFLFPLTYGREDKYVEQVEEKIKQLNINHIIFNEFMNFDSIAEYSVISDIMIQLQITDTLSASMQEHMYAGGIVITGSWLPYKILNDNGIFFKQIDKIEDVGEELKEVLYNLKTYQEKCKRNREIIRSMSSWENTLKNWKDTFTNMYFI